METNPNIRDPQTRSRNFFILGYVFLFAMGLCWSIDTSIVYILFGTAVYFLFLGFYTNKAFKKSHERPRNVNQSSTHKTSLGDEFKNLFEKYQSSQKGTQRPFTTQPTSSQTSKQNRPIFGLVVTAMFVIFLLFFNGSIFSSSDDWDSVNYYQLAEQNYSDGNYDSAYTNYRKALKINEGYVEAMVGYGNVLATRKQSDSAMIMYDKAIEIDPEYKEASYRKGLALFDLEKYNESIALLNPLLQEQTDYYDAMLLMGDCYYALRQYDEAMNWYNNAYNNGGLRSRALCHIMAYIYDTKGNFDQAIPLYKEALSYDSTVVDIYKRLGELLPNEEGNYYRTEAVKLEQR